MRRGTLQQLRQLLRRGGTLRRSTLVGRPGKTIRGECQPPDGHGYLGNKLAAGDPGGGLVGARLMRIF